MRKLSGPLAEVVVGMAADKHLGVVYSASVLAPSEPAWEPTPEEVEDAKKRAAGDNFGMPVAEIREGSVVT